MKETFDELSTERDYWRIMAFILGWFLLLINIKDTTSELIKFLITFMGLFLTYRLIEIVFRKNKKEDKYISYSKSQTKYKGEKVSN